uniref:Pirin n=1 Tax=Oncorhynchus mykiss TaxID=8022 RepID=A0A8K9Y209_ONCMY
MWLVIVFCVCVCVCLSLSVSVYVCFCVRLCVSMPLCICVCVFLCPSLCVCPSLYLCVCVSVSFSVCQCLSVSVYVCFCVRLCVSMPLCICVCVFLCPSLCVCPSLYLCVCVSVSVSVCLCLSVSVCVCFCVCLCVSLSLHKWMTAGRGVVHAEMPVSEEPVQGLQLWVNLRREDKMVEPQYQELKDSQVPKPSREGVTVAVISGQALGVQSKIFTRTPTLYLDFKLDVGAKHVQPVPSGPDAEQQKVEPHHTIVFDDGDCIAVENKASEVCHFVLIAGQPINEPVVQHGPFVMNTEEEINQAVRDYRTGTNGFERATAWRSKIRDSF